MSNYDLYMSACGLITILWAIAITSRLASIRNEARKQTKLLEEIASYSRPPEKRQAGESSAKYDPGFRV